MTMKPFGLLVGVLLIGTSACGGNAGSSTRDARSTATPRGDTAVWNVDPSRPPAAQDASFTALAERLGCAGGQTGKVLAPNVVERSGEVVVTFAVQALSPGVHTCPGNKPVPYRVTLPHALGARHLLDGSCLAGEAATTSFCLGGAQRWPLPNP